MNKLLNELEENFDPIFSDIDLAHFIDSMNLKLKNLILKHANELWKYYNESTKYNTDIELLHYVYLFNAYDTLCYYNEYLGGIKQTDKDTIAELLYTAELNICGENTDGPSYIINITIQL